MEFEGLNEKIKWELRRGAAAFGATINRCGKDEDKYVCSAYISMEVGVIYMISPACEFVGAAVLQPSGLLIACDIILEVNDESESEWVLTPHPQFNEAMAQGLYRLGFEDEDIVSQLPPLSAHEKLELRLSMPREFWPQKWRDGEVV